MHYNSFALFSKDLKRKYSWIGKSIGAGNILLNPLCGIPNSFHSGAAGEKPV
jgi:hypothetical protein